MMRLEVRGLVRDQRVRRGVRFVEAVTRKPLHQVEEFVGLGLLQPVLRRTVAEGAAVLRHLLGQLFAHCAAQQVGAAETVAADDLSHLHHLLLVHHDAVGLRKHRLHSRVGIVERLAVLARDEIRDQLHRPRAVERNERDDVLETVGARLLQELAHAARFKLEHGRRVRAGENPVCARILERQRFQRQRRRGIEALHVAQRPVEDGQRGEPEKIEFDEPHRLHVFHVELAHHAVGARRRVKRAKFGELARRDQHPARMHADVARETLQLLREREQLAHLLLVLLALVDLRLHLARIDRLLVRGVGAPPERHVLAGLERHELGDLVAEVVAEIEHAPDIAHHRLRRHGAEGDDLRHAVGAVLGAHVLDHAVAAVLAEIDVEVRHRHALGIEETLEQQVVAQRVEIGDAERVGNQ